MQSLGKVCFVKLSLLLGLFTGAFGQPVEALLTSYQSKALPVLEEYCYDCHGREQKKEAFLSMAIRA